MVLKYPDIRTENCIFKELFTNPTYLTDNGCLVIGTPTISQGGVFNGNTDAINANQILLVDAVSFSTVGSIEAVLSTNDITANQEIISFGDTDADTRIQFDIYSNGKLRALAGVTGATQWALETDSAVFSNGVTVRIALVQDGVNPVLYVNGLQVPQTFTTSTDKTYWFSQMSGIDNARIGCGNWNSGGNALFFNGTIFNVHLFKDVLSLLELVDRQNGTTYSKVEIQQLEYFLNLRNHYNNGVSEIVPNIGVIGDDTIKWGDGSVATTMPTLLEFNGASFDGGDYISFSNPILIDNTMPFSIGCLFQCTSAAAMYLSDVREGGNKGFAVNITSGQINVLIDAGGVGKQVATITTYNDGMWHSLFVSISPLPANQFIEIYVDGVLSTSGSTDKFTNASASQMIGATVSLANKFTGSMKFPFLWRTALTPTQVRWQNYLRFKELNS